MCSQKRPLSGGVSPLPHDEALLYANAVFAKFVGLGDNSKYNTKSITIESATQQVVAGAIYRIKARLDGATVCDISYWYRPWLGDPQVEVKCNDDEKIKFSVPDPQKSAVAAPLVGAPVRRDDAQATQALVADGVQAIADQHGAQFT